MPTGVRTFFSGLVQTFVGTVVALLASHGFDVPAQWSAVATSAILAGGLALYMLVVHVLANMKGNGVVAKVARFIAGLMTAGFGPLVGVKRPAVTG